MRWKLLPIAAGIVLLIVALLELVQGGGIAGLGKCSLSVNCYSQGELSSLETGIVLTVFGVLALLAATSMGRKPGD